ncbi:MAG: hypothetical protein E6J13_05140 [Chloroflexi bacterium]|nr:MAG: hypothetical protein E6J13_05140 [Chloroflexota bacterium]
MISHEQCRSAEERHGRRCAARRYERRTRDVQVEAFAGDLVADRRFRLTGHDQGVITRKDEDVLVVRVEVLVDRKCAAIRYGYVELATDVYASRFALRGRRDRRNHHQRERQRDSKHERAGLARACVEHSRHLPFFGAWRIRAQRASATREGIRSATG